MARLTDIGKEIATGLAVIVLTAGLPNISGCEMRPSLTPSEERAQNLRFYKFSGEASDIKEEGYNDQITFYRERILLTYNKDPKNPGYFRIFETRKADGKNIWEASGYSYNSGGANFDDFFEVFKKQMPGLGEYFKRRIQSSGAKVLNFRISEYYDRRRLKEVKFIFPDGKVESLYPPKPEPEKPKKKSLLWKLFHISSFDLHWAPV